MKDEDIKSNEYTARDHSPEKDVIKLVSDSLKFYKKSGTRNRVDYYLANSAMIILSSVIPIMVYATPDRKLLQAATAAVVGMLAGINSFFRFRENWIKNINAAHALEIELTKFKARIGEEYSPNSSSQTALDNFMKNYEAIAETALTEWRTIVSMTADQAPIQAPPSRIIRN